MDHRRTINAEHLYESTLPADDIEEDFLSFQERMPVCYCHFSRSQNRQEIGYDLSTFLWQRRGWSLSLPRPGHQSSPRYAGSQVDAVMNTGMSAGAVTAACTQAMACSMRNFERFPPYKAEDEMVTQRRLLCWLAYCMVKDYELESKVPRGAILNVDEVDQLMVLSHKMRSYSVPQLLGQAHVDGHDHWYQIFITAVRTNILVPCDKLKIPKGKSLASSHEYFSNQYLRLIDICRSGDSDVERLPLLCQLL